MEKRKSKIHGTGIFTKKKIPKGKIFYKVPITKIVSKAKNRFAYIGKERWVDDEKVLNYVNHSCAPNTILNIKRKQPTLIAKKNILPNEEITVDYNLTEKEGDLIKCNCNSKKCKRFFNIAK